LKSLDRKSFAYTYILRQALGRPRLNLSLGSQGKSFLKRLHDVPSAFTGQAEIEVLCLNGSIQAEHRRVLIHHPNGIRIDGNSAQLLSHLQRVGLHSQNLTNAICVQNHHARNRDAVKHPRTSISQSDNIEKICQTFAQSSTFRPLSSALLAPSELLKGMSVTKPLRFPIDASDAAPRCAALRAVWRASQNVYVVQARDFESEGTSHLVATRSDDLKTFSKIKDCFSNWPSLADLVVLCVTSQNASLAILRKSFSSSRGPMKRHVLPNWYG
jgi:hypothetical protein